MARPWSARCYGVARQREGSRQNSIGGSGVLSLRHFGLVLFIPWRVGAEENLARRRRLGPPGFRFMVSAGAMLLDRLGPPGFRFRFIDFRAPRFPFTSATPRARGRCWPGRGPLLRGSSPTRGVAPKQHRGARACFHSGISGWFSLSLGAWVPKRIWRGEGGSGRLDLDLWFRPARCCSIGSGRPDLDLDLSISGPRASLLHQLHRVREGAAGQAVARCYGVARPREGSRQNSIERVVGDFTPALRVSFLYPSAR